MQKDVSGLAHPHTPRLLERQPARSELPVIGIGRSMGALLAIVRQSPYRGFDAPVLLNDYRASQGIFGSAWDGVRQIWLDGHSLLGDGGINLRGIRGRAGDE